MALIWNAKIFKRAGLDPEKPPKTWDDLVTYTKPIHDKLGIAGYGLVAKQNAGNTPFRFMPQLWAYGGGGPRRRRAQAELGHGRDQQPATKRGTEGLLRDVRARQVGTGLGLDQHPEREPERRSSPASSGMMIAHPAEYAKMVDLAPEGDGRRQGEGDGRSSPTCATV